MDCQELKEIAEAKGKTVAQVRSIYSIPALLSAFFSLAAWMDLERSWLTDMPEMGVRVWGLRAGKELQQGQDEGELGDIRLGAHRGRAAEDQ